MQRLMCSSRRSVKRPIIANRADRSRRNHPAAVDLENTLDTVVEHLDASRAVVEADTFVAHSQIVVDRTDFVVVEAEDMIAGCIDLAAGCRIDFEARRTDCVGRIALVHFHMDQEHLDDFLGADDCLGADDFLGAGGFLGVDDCPGVVEAVADIDSCCIGSADSVERLHIRQALRVDQEAAAAHNLAAVTRIEEQD